MIFKLKIRSTNFEKLHLRAQMEFGNDLEHFYYLLDHIFQLNSVPGPPDVCHKLGTHITAEIALKPPPLLKAPGEKYV